jgi:hypothetical protein
MNKEIINSRAEYQTSREMLPEPVYYIESPDDNSVLVGIDVTIHTEQNGEKRVTWYDSNRERSMLADEMRKKDGYFAFKRDEREGGGMYFFEPMNLNIYNEKVKDRLIDGKDFNNIEDLVEAFQDTLEN